VNNIELFCLFNMIAGTSISLTSQKGATGTRTVVGSLFFRLS